MVSIFFVALLSCIPLVHAVPAPLRTRSETALSPSQLSDLAPFTQFARAAYCPTGLNDWTCGGACDALSGFQPTLVGGDGNNVQTFFVGYWPNTNSIVVGHEGTDPTKFLSLLTDVDIFMGTLDSALFPGVSSTTLVHQGFRNAHAKTASQILTEVKNLMGSKNTNSVVLVGHSLGGAIAVLDALFLTLNVPGISTKVVSFGTPRVGNPEFAALIDSKIPDFSRVNNERDLIPILPGRFLGFEHPEGEIHIISPGKAVTCSGDDNGSDPDCTDSVVPSILNGNILNHLGPYEGINIGTIFCH
ncbi:hypothetical protein AX17_004468 [Amanita inopinata Kibby_2008]|nr:hypothetical protein AX17_004468 [Amanita inopinata Kibby_2008]